MLPRIQRVTESVVAAAVFARRGRFGHWFSVEDVVAGHRAVNRGKGIGIVAVAGFTERIIAGAWCVVFTEAESGGEKVKNGEITFAASGVGDVKESGGDGWVVVGTSEQGVASVCGMGKEREECEGHGSVDKPGLIKRDGSDFEVRVGRVVGPMCVGEETVDA